MNENNRTVIEIQKGREYHILVENYKNIYDESKFFYPVYRKCIELVKEIHSNYSNENVECYRDERDFPNNIIMFCAERGGGKSSAMRTFANALDNFEKEKENDRENFERVWGNNFSNCNFSVLKIIDPTAIGEKDLFMRIILSRMFSALRKKWEENSFKGKNAWSKDDNNRLIQNRNNIVKKFMECYRYLDVIYQSGSKFECDDDLEDLTDLGDSGQLKEVFWELVKEYLLEMTESKSNNSYLVIQVDDADLNSKMAFNIIEDIRKYCIIPNIIILMAVNMNQMHQVIEQHFVCDFQTLLNASKSSSEENEAIKPSDCHNMAIRYIDKIMPASHQIYLPTIDDFIRNNGSELTVKYIETRNGSDKNLLEFTNKSGMFISDYQETLIRLIYNKTGITLVKANGYVHNILPKTMRGINHFMAYMCPLEDLNQNIGISEINTILNYKTKKSIKNFNRNDAEKELNKRIINLDAFEQYFLKNWCAIRLTTRYQHAIDEIANAASEQKVPIAIKWTNKLFNKGIINESIGYVPSLSSSSYAFLLEKLRNISKEAHLTKNANEEYEFTYAVRFYFIILFNRVVLSCIKNGGKFEALYKLTNMELWEPCHSIYFQRSLNNMIDHFKVNYKILARLTNPVDNQGEKRIAGDTTENRCAVRIGKNNYHFDRNDRNVQAEINNPKINLFYDLSADMLYNACKKEDSEKFLKCKNCCLLLLLNWDLQQYAEKASALKKIISDNSYEFQVNTLAERVLKAIFEQLDSIAYLPIEWSKNTSAINSFMNFSDINILLQSNKRFILEFVKASINFLEKSTKEIFLPSNDAINTSEEYAEQLRTQITIFSKVNPVIIRLKRWSNISQCGLEEINKLYGKWQDFYELFLKCQRIIEEVDKRSFQTIYYESADIVMEMQKPFNEWRIYISQKDHIINNIQNEIIEAFEE